MAVRPSQRLPMFDTTPQLDCAGRVLVLDRTRVIGIVNVTPDSFSDGGCFADAPSAIAHGLEMHAAGADYVDVGGESTRPGSDPVSAEVEIERVVPVIERLARHLPGIPISIDTRKPEVAAAALAVGAAIVNDVSAGSDPEMFELAGRHRAGIVLMHMKGDPKTMQVAPSYDDVVAEVHEYLRERIEAAEFAGIEPERIVVDPGIGFGKDLSHNLELIRRIDAFLDLGRPLLVGPSRKRFIGTLLDLPEDERVEGTAAAVAWSVSRGAHVVRVHDVKEIVRVVRVVDAIAKATA